MSRHEQTANDVPPRLDRVLALHRRALLQRCVNPLRDKGIKVTG
jgi:hypothetical protein